MATKKAADEFIGDLLSGIPTLNKETEVKATTEKKAGVKTETKSESKTAKNSTKESKVEEKSSSKKESAPIEKAEKKTSSVKDKKIQVRRAKNYSPIPASVNQRKLDGDKVHFNCYITEEQYNELRIQAATRMKESDISAFTRTALDVLLDMDASIYLTIKETAIMNDLSVAEVINELLEKALEK